MMYLVTLLGGYLHYIWVHVQTDVCIVFTHTFLRILALYLVTRSDRYLHRI
jgi:hypothetical protein